MTISSLHIIGAKKSGGAEKFFIRLTTGLAEKGYAVHAIIPPNAEIDKELPDTVKRTYIKMSNVYDVFSRRKINNTINKLNPSIVQTYMGRATRLTHLRNSAEAIHIARLGGYYNLKGYQHAHAWVGNTTGICQYLVANGLTDDKVFKVGNFTDKAIEYTDHQLLECRLQHGIPENAYVLLSVSRLHHNKAIDTLLNAFKLLPATVNERPLHLMVVGEGPDLDKLNKLTQSLDLTARVHWPGWQPQTSLYYQSADIFICPSRHEPLGNVILEAWSNQTPVISTKTDGANELMINKQNGLLVAIDDKKEMAQTILSLLKANQQDLQLLVNNATSTLNSNYSKETIIEAYIKLYQQLISNKNRPIL